MLSDPSRLSILRTLMQGERHVNEIVEETELSQANVSKHLRLLSHTGLVARRKDGLRAYYRIVDPMVERICSVACDALSRELGKRSSR